MTTNLKLDGATIRPRYFYGWYIVGVGILVNIAGNIRLLQHAQHFSQTHHRGVERFTRSFFVDPHFRDRCRSADRAAARSVDRPPRRPRRLRSRRSHGRNRALAFQSGAKLLAVRSSPLLFSNCGRSFTGFLGHQRNDRPMVRAQARPSDGHRQLGHGPSQTQHSFGRRILVCTDRLAQHVGRLRHRRTALGHGAGVDLHTPQTGRHGASPRWRSASSKIR